MSKIANKQMICEVLMDAAKQTGILLLCAVIPEAAVPLLLCRYLSGTVCGNRNCRAESGKHCCRTGKVRQKAYAVSPACFLSTRSYEQAKVDVAYSNTNVKLIGISGGVSYGALGMSHHSAQDIAAMAAIPNMRVYIPSDHLQTRELVKALLKDENRLMCVWGEMQ